MNPYRLVLGRVVLPIIGALVFILVVGFLEIRAHAVENGVIIDWSNMPIAVTAPGSPYLQRVAIAALAGAILYVVWPACKHEARGIVILPSAAIGLTLIAVSAWFLLAATSPYLDPVGAALSTDSAAISPIRQSDSPALAWARAGGLSPAVHTLAAAMLVPAVLAGFTSRRRHSVVRR